jgi:hypothetical protein
MLLIFIVIIIGNIKAISTSKIKKINAIKKNCNEKGNRDELNGSNPHSKGEFFSRSKIIFFEIIDEIIITIKEINSVVIIIINSIKIIYIINIKLYDWKSYILFILYK